MGWAFSAFRMLSIKQLLCCFGLGKKESSLLFYDWTLVEDDYFVHEKSFHFQTKNNIVNMKLLLST